ncbi:fatty acyl-CoA reductase 1-like [Ctenocephalides felis]|uniref:fatty acyl-CoA reductase 1-like n=1 Tax=Ctenocephalides felis TaxID=7515 RepID=UPI000E6E1E6F|nr:fatty acyl-CoA reductase 1-like [Ctenocephalides felis]
MDAINIPQFFVDKTIFITGGSGKFMGKCIIEKLLRSCPDLEAIYLLIRPKRGKPAANRVQEILENKLFDVVRNTTPSAFEKVFAVTGDVTSLQLGLNDQDKKLVLTSHVVFHAAASVRFDDPLKKAILMNTRGTREIMELMLQMPNLVVGVHVSTTYCNTDKDVIEEKVYRDHGDWKEAIRLAEGYQDEYKLDILTNKYIGDLHNTYLLTKHLAENVVDDYSHRLPLVLFRPGIVISTWKDPIPGWNDNYNGPIGICLGVGKGNICLEAFWFTLEHFDMYEYYMNAVIGINRYVVKERDDVQENIKQYKRLVQELEKVMKDVIETCKLLSEPLPEKFTQDFVPFEAIEHPQIYEKFRQPDLEKIRKDLIRIFDELEIKPSLDFKADLLSDSEMEVTDADYVEKLERSKNIVLELRESLSPLWERLEEDLNVRNKFLLKYPGHGNKTVSALRES